MIRRGLSAEEAIKAARDRYRQMRLASTRASDQDDIALLCDEIAAGEIAHQVLVDQCVFEPETVDIFGERQLGYGQLIFE